MCDCVKCHIIFIEININVIEMLMQEWSNAGRHIKSMQVLTFAIAPSYTHPQFNTLIYWIVQLNLKDGIVHWTTFSLNTNKKLKKKKTTTKKHPLKVTVWPTFLSLITLNFIFNSPFCRLLFFFFGQMERLICLALQNKWTNRHRREEEKIVYAN